MDNMQFDISLQLCFAKINQLSEYEKRGFLDRDCNSSMKEFILAYCIWLNTVYTMGISVQGFSSLAESVNQLPKLNPETKQTMVDTLKLNAIGRMEWLNLWNMHIFQFMNPPYWNEYQKLSAKWFEEYT